MLTHPTVKIEFTNQKNKLKYKKAVLNWLKADFYEQENPKNHFWNNRKIIAAAFDKCDAMVALNNQNKVIGYMIWRADHIWTEIDIIEVKKEYRGQGIFKKMLADYINKFTDICILTASVLTQAQNVFIHADWKIANEIDVKMDNSSNQTMETKYFFKIIKECVPAQEILPSGQVLAVCPVSYYEFINNRKVYSNKIQYFPIDIDESLKLRQPIIVTGFNYEHYIGIYYNKELIVEGKASHLFADDICHRSADLLMINRIALEPDKQNLFNNTEFFPKVIVNKIPESMLISSIEDKSNLSSTGSIGFFASSSEKDEKPIIIEQANKRNHEDDDEDDKKLSKKLRKSTEVEDTEIQQTFKLS